MPKTPARVLCDSPELALEFASAAANVGLELAPEVAPNPFSYVSGRDPHTVAVASIERQEPTRVLELAASDAVLCAPGHDEAMRLFRDLATEAGLVAVATVEAAVAVLALREAAATKPWNATRRGLVGLDQVRLAPIGEPGERAAGRFSRQADGVLGWSANNSTQTRLIGRPEAVRDGALAMKLASQSRNQRADQSSSFATRSDSNRVAQSRELLFGPPRSLSDPASKAALRPYGVTFPTEELCTTPSRAAAEATRMGFPVRIALASPDLRLWEHPDLGVDNIDNAARVRDVFRQVTSAAQGRSNTARVLGVTVSATAEAAALLSASVTPLNEDQALAIFGFADPHGIASADRTIVLLPTSPERIRSALGRLAGGTLITDSPAKGKELEAIADLLNRIAEFVADHARDVRGVDLNPIAILLDGGLEAREARVVVSDSFERALEREDIPA